MSFGSDQPLITNQLSDFDVPDKYEDFQDLFEQEYKKVIDVVNSKEGALYLPQELATYQRYFYPDQPGNTRNVYRKLLVFGALPNATSKRMEHNVSFNNVTRMTRMFGAATNPSSLEYIPLPFASPTLVNNVSLEADQTDVIITTAVDYSNYSDVTIVIEYIKG